MERNQSNHECFSFRSNVFVTIKAEPQIQIQSTHTDVRERIANCKLWRHRHENGTEDDDEDEDGDFGACNNKKRLQRVCFQKMRKQFICTVITLVIISLKLCSCITILNKLVRFIYFSVFFSLPNNNFSNRFTSPTSSCCCKMMPCFVRKHTTFRRSFRFWKTFR